ncbi:ubiquitin-activating E1 FCCH domain-containing protein [Brevundimonas sp.]|uniref:ubiquitin-activating E1 FCCH domain-containing protein n=1 Tax=Brevundimonas sp. TaxID=1871086 RepID=UPI0035B3F848
MDLAGWIARVTHGWRDFAGRLAGETRGNVAMLFALSVPVLILMTVGGVDIHRASTVRVNLQDALDAAALAAARSPYVDNVDIQRVGMAALKANLKAYPNITLREADTAFVLQDEVVIATSKVDVKTLVANIFLPPYGKFMDDYLPVGAHSEVDRSSRNIEVALVLDITGSMGGTKLSDLKAAAKELVDLVVQPVQTPYYSKIALVPYSMAVNAGSYADGARGSIAGSVNITNAVLNLAGTQKTITAATNGRPVVITAASHGFSNGDVVWISGVSGMTPLNNKAFRVANRTTNGFELRTLSGYYVDGRNWNGYAGGGRVQQCQNNDCSIVITAAGHGLSNNDYVYIEGVNGMTQINNEAFLVGNATSNTFTIDPNVAALSPYTSGGRAWCAQPGCTWYAFENMYGDLTVHRVSSCVTERSGAQAYTDAAPSTARVGRNYPGGSNPCLSATVLPLSSDRTTLKNRIDGFSASGSTAGQIGMAWGWYMVSPSFNSLWPSGAAAPYNTAETLKAVIIMTDGEFNTPYCNGVIARDAGSGSGSNSSKIDCSSTNGSPFAQGRELCDGMKARNVVVYTVGFQLAEGGDAASLMQYCASKPANFFLPASGGDLSEAFAAIGRDITQLRISR